MRASGQIHGTAITKAHTSATNNPCDGKTPKKGYPSPRAFSQPHFPTAHASSHPPGALPHPFFTLTLYQQKEKEAAPVAKQINRCREGENTNQLNHTPAPSLVGKKLLRPLAHGTVAFTKMSCPSGLIFLPAVGKPITWLRGALLLRILCQNYSEGVGK